MDEATSQANGSLVSVIIPTYNREKFLPECVRSVFDQTYRPIEIVVVDDGSTDGTLKVLKELAVEAGQKDGLFFASFTVPNGGAPRARNLGFEKSSGDYVVFLDSDDMFLPQKVSKQMVEMLKGGYDLVYSRNQRIDRDGRQIKMLSGRRLSQDSRDLFEYSWQTMCAIYKRSYVEKIGPWNESLPISQDWEYSIRAVLAEGSIGFLDEALQVYRYHEEGRIGDQKTLVSIKGKEVATWTVFWQIVTVNKLDDWLRNKYRKRLLYCASQYSLKGDVREFARLQNEMIKAGLIGRCSAFFWRIFLTGSSGKVVLAIYSRFQRVKKRMKRKTVSSG